MGNVKLRDGRVRNGQVEVRGEMDPTEIKRE